MRDEFEDFFAAETEVTTEAAEAVGVDDVADVEPSVETSAVIQSDDWREIYGGRVALDEESKNWIFFDVLTVPDALRGAAGVAGPAKKERVDLAGIEKLSASEVKALVTPSLPDDQLLALAEHENRVGLKPRKVAADAIRIERNRRGAETCEACGQTLDSWDHWVCKSAADPFLSSIAAIVIAAADGEPEVYVVGRDGDEAEALEWFWSHLQTTEDVGLGYLGKCLACPDWFSAWRVVGVRSLYHDVPNRSGELVNPHTSRGAVTMKQYDLSTLALAYGLKVPYVAGPASVCQAVQDCQYAKIAAIASAKLEAGRAVVLAERSIS